LTDGVRLSDAVVGEPEAGKVSVQHALRITDFAVANQVQAGVRWLRHCFDATG
jgi:hypothetical protein